MPSNLWDRFKEASSETTPEPSSAKARATWLGADDPGNPFGVPLLDLMVTQTVMATSQDPEAAQRAGSWGSSLGEELDVTLLEELPPIECEIRLPIDSSLPEGLMFTPSSMDEKWVIAWRGGRIIAARSWTGAVDTVAEARVDGGELVIEALRIVEASAFERYGSPHQVFEWFLRSHALGEKLPCPIGDDAAEYLETTPLAAFSDFGRLIFCAARAWSPPPAPRPLRSDGRIIRAAQSGDVDAVSAAVAEGEEIDAPSAYQGYTALHFAIVKNDLPMFEHLLELGADVNCRGEWGVHAATLAIVRGAPPEIFEALVAKKADLSIRNDDGFGALHAAAESGNAWAVTWLHGHGIELEDRTKHGHTAFQIACALGHLEAAQALAAAGADINATSPSGTAADIAARGDKKEIVDWLESLGSPKEAE